MQLLVSSVQNTGPRYSAVIAYNAARNNPYTRRSISYYKTGRNPEFPLRWYRRTHHVGPSRLNFERTWTLRVLETVILVGDREVRLGHTTYVLEVRLLTDMVMAVRQMVATNQAYACVTLVRADTKDYGVNQFPTYSAVPVQQTRCSKCGRAPHSHPNLKRQKLNCL